jgi:hypothetical protein
VIITNSPQNYFQLSIVCGDLRRSVLHTIYSISWLSCKLLI